MLTDSEQVNMLGPNKEFNETKYKIVMRLAERWGIEALQRNMDPRDLCTERFKKLDQCHHWSEVTKVIVTAFVIREHETYRQFLHD